MTFWAMLLIAALAIAFVLILVWVVVDKLLKVFDKPFFDD